MTIVTRGDDATLNQIVKQLNKLVDIIEVLDFREGEYVDRELVLVDTNLKIKHTIQLSTDGEKSGFPLGRPTPRVQSEDDEP